MTSLCVCNCRIGIKSDNGNVFLNLSQRKLICRKRERLERICLCMFSRTWLNVEHGIRQIWQHNKSHTGKRQITCPAVVPCCPEADRHSHSIASNWWFARNYSQWFRFRTWLYIPLHQRHCCELNCKKLSRFMITVPMTCRVHVSAMSANDSNLIESHFWKSHFHDDNAAVNIRCNQTAALTSNLVSAMIFTTWATENRFLENVSITNEYVYAGFRKRDLNHNQKSGNFNVQKIVLPKQREYFVRINSAIYVRTRGCWAWIKCSRMELHLRVRNMTSPLGSLKMRKIELVSRREIFVSILWAIFIRTHESWAAMWCSGMELHVLAPKIVSPLRSL